MPSATMLSAPQSFRTLSYHTYEESGSDGVHCIADSLWRQSLHEDENRAQFRASVVLTALLTTVHMHVQ
jgi:hypothetical protein